MLSGKTTSVRSLSGHDSGPAAGTNETRRVELDNGMVAYHKPFRGENDHLARAFGQTSHQQGVHEAAAWQLAYRLGPPWSEIVPPVVIREVDGDLGSFALERPGKVKEMDPWSTGEWREAAFFDSLIGQQDRHPANYLVAGDRIYLIDHGYSFARDGDYLNHSWLRSRRLHSSPELTYGERDALQRLIASPDLLGLAPMIERDRAAALTVRAERMLRTGRIADAY